MTGGRPAPLGACLTVSTPALWTLLAPCANICRMTAVAPESVAAPDAPVDDPAGGVAEEELVLADLLVEEISIDGMCGVY